MNILFINIAHQAIGSRVPSEHLPPLGLLCVAGPLIDNGHQAELLDADLLNLSTSRILDHVISAQPGVIMFGHSGSTSAQPIIDETASAIKNILPGIPVILGGVYPTYHYQEILEQNNCYDYIVRGEGEQICLDLLNALQSGKDPAEVKGIAFKTDTGSIVRTPPAGLIRKPGDYRVAWELTKKYSYTYWGNQPAMLVQFSRGCPHQCHYCGQTRFWQQWRYRNPEKLAAEIAYLHREYGVKVINLADENPTSSRAMWKRFLEALIRENVPVQLVCSARADDIVRDADILHLYRRAGIIRFLMGMESYEQKTLDSINKGSRITNDMLAIRLLRKHGIISMVSWVVGFVEDRPKNFIHGIRQLLTYDPDQIQIMYFTPHKWTPIFKHNQNRKVIQTDLRKWDYKHQVLKMKFMKAWQCLLWVKLTEAVLQLRPKALWRVFLHPCKDFRHAMQWYSAVGRKVWPLEIFKFLFREKRKRKGMPLWQFFSHPVDTLLQGEENHLQSRPASQKSNAIKADAQCPVTAPVPSFHHSYAPDAEFST